MEEVKWSCSGVRVIKLNTHESFPEQVQVLLVPLKKKKSHERDESLQPVLIAVLFGVMKVP